MTRNLKMLGLALVAVLAMSSLAASAASATDHVITVGQTPMTLTADQHNGNAKLTLAGQSVECTNAKIVAHIEVGSPTTLEQVTTTSPTYTGCTYGGAAMTVTMNGCDYLLTGKTDASGDAKVHVKCPAGKKISLTLNSLACEVFVEEQEAEEGYTMTTVGSGSTQELTLHITAKVKVKSKGDPGEGVTCASLTNGTGTLCGTYTVTGETEGPNPVHVAVTDSVKT